MSILAIASDRLNVYEMGDELAQRGWSVDRQQFPPSLHLTVTPAHAQVADQFLDDLRAAAKQAGRPSRARLSNAVLVGLAQTAARILPPRLISALTARASHGALAGRGGAQRSAALYGMVGSLPNRGDLGDLALEVLDGMTLVDPRGDGSP
jgi:hypothetical protein